jgi:hypothetical protein
MSRKPKQHPELDLLRHLMGQIPDHEIAHMAGTTAPIVGRYRRRLGVDGYEGHKFGNRDNPATSRSSEQGPPEEEAPAVDEAEEKVANRRPSRLDPYIDVLGKVPDAEIARMAGVTPQNVRAFRSRHKIAPVWREESEVSREPAAPAATAETAPPPRPLAAPSSVGLKEGYAAIMEGSNEEILVVGVDMVDAAERLGAGLGSRVQAVVCLRHIGPAIG